MKRSRVAILASQPSRAHGGDIQNALQIATRQLYVASWAALRKKFFMFWGALGVCMVAFFLWRTQFQGAPIVRFFLEVTIALSVPTLFAALCVYGLHRCPRCGDRFFLTATFGRRLIRDHCSSCGLEKGYVPPEPRLYRGARGASLVAPRLGETPSKLPTQIPTQQSPSKKPTSIPKK